MFLVFVGFMLDSHYLPIFKVKFKMKYLKYYFLALLLIELHGKIHVWIDFSHLHWVYSVQCICIYENICIGKFNITLIANEKTIASAENRKVTYT